MPNLNRKPWEPFYTDPDEVDQIVNDYFNTCDNYLDPVTGDPDPQPYTIPGIAIHLGFASRQSFFHYVNKGKREGIDENSKRIAVTLQKAKSRIEEQRVSKMVRGHWSTIGAIFDLKNNFGYHDRQEIQSQQVITIRPAELTKAEDAGLLSTKSAELPAIEHGISTGADDDNP